MDQQEKRRPNTLIIIEDMEHEHKFTKKVRNDMNTKWLYLCEVCDAQDGTKFWGMLNDKWDLTFNRGALVRRRIKKFPWLKNKFS